MYGGRPNYLVEYGELMVSIPATAEDVDIPSLGWFSQAFIQIIHKTDIAGSTLFNLNIQSMESTLLVDSQFTNVWKLVMPSGRLLKRQIQQKSTEIDLVLHCKANP